MERKNDTQKTQSRQMKRIGKFIKYWGRGEGGLKLGVILDNLGKKEKMGQEIERKFLIDREKWEKAEKPRGEKYRQGYMVSEPEKTIRVRVTEAGGYITIKGKTHGATRAEYEYEIPIEDAEELIDKFCNSELSKVRYVINFKGKKWEVDEFAGENRGLIIAEIELVSEGEEFEKPDWAGEEVTGDARYYNSNLAKGRNKEEEPRNIPSSRDKRLTRI